MMGFFKSATAAVAKPSPSPVSLTTDDLSVKVLKKITDIRRANYRSALINELVEADLAELKKITMTLGYKILTANTHFPKAEELAIAKHKLEQTLNNLFDTNNKMLIASFSAQLIQYHTIICDEEFIAGASLEELDKFLTKNAEKFGAINNNLLVTEYKLIKIYNEICHFNDAAKGEVAPVAEMDKKINYLVEQLTSFKAQIHEWLASAPDDIFVNYLNFALCYSCAKAFELQYSLQRTNLSEVDLLALAESQNIFLKTAKESLTNISTIIELAVEEERMINGSEFSLGQNVLIKVPASVETLCEHLSSSLL